MYRFVVKIYQLKIENRLTCYRIVSFENKKLFDIPLNRIFKE